MGLTNRIENMLIAGGTALISTAIIIVVVHLLTIQPLQRQIERQNEVIIELAKIEKYRYEINNDFAKMKPRDGNIVIDLDNKLQALQVNEPDSITPAVNKKTNFWRRLKFW